MKSKVAYIVVGWNNRELLGECFESIQEQTYRDKVVYYIDNSSNDDSVAFMSAHFPEVMIIEPGYNTGFAKGNNLAIAQALEDEEVAYIVLLNSDARLAPDWTERIVTFAQLKPKGALFQGTTLDYYNHHIIDSTHIYVARNGQGTQGKWRYYYKAEFGPKRVYGVNAAACLITRAFIDAQPFKPAILDETMFMYLEDIDLVTRATLLGWDNYLVAGARAYHMGSASSGKNPGFSLYMTFRNNSAVLFKNFPLGLVLRMLPQIIRGDFQTIQTLRRLGRKAAARKVVQGRLIGLLRLPLFLHKRFILQRHIEIDKQKLWRLMERGY